MIRAYRCTDEPELVAAWNAALPYDPIDAATFRRKVLLDPNFDPEWLPVAEVEGRLGGFCLCLRDRVQASPGWITAFGVVPEHRRTGLGSALLDRALELFTGAGCPRVSIAPYVPHYFVPGVDERNYAEGLAFLQRRGFETVSRPLSMDANLVLFDYGPFAAREERLRAEGIDVRGLLPHEFLPLLAYLREHASPDWLRDARELLTDITRGLATEAQFTVAVRGDRQIVGYCQFRGEHFGPFGVREDLQGRGIGTVLLAQCLQTMRRQGLHNAWVLWTSDEAAARVYGKLGFRETRRFAVLRREL